MPNCSVCCCKKRSGTSNLQKDGVTFHIFPKNLLLKDTWKEFCNNKRTWEPKRTSVLCSIHFETNDFQNLANGRRKLVEHAVPRLIPNCTCFFHPLPVGPSRDTVGANTSASPNLSTSLDESSHRQPQEQQMVSKYKRKTSMASWDEDVMRLAMEEAKKSSVRAAAIKYGINLSTLQRHVKKGCPKLKLGRYRTIFTENQENELLKLCQTDSLDGLTRKEFLMIAYKYAKAKNICNSFKNGTAGTEWYKGFEKRHPGLKFPYVKPKAGSNKVQMFCELLEKIKVEVNVKYEAGSQDEESRIVSSEEKQVSANSAIIIRERVKVVAELLISYTTLDQ